MTKVQSNKRSKKPSVGVDEFAWRLNEGNVKRHSLERLASFVDAIVGKRLTYARLIAKVPA